MPRIGLGNNAARRHAACEPDIATNARAPTYRDAAEYRRPGIHHHIVLKNGVARRALFQHPVSANFKELGAQRHHLVQTHALTDDGGLADDHARAMINEKTGTDLRARVNVDARF